MSGQTPGSPSDGDSEDTECLIHFDLELFIWLEVANGQITTLRWYLLFYYLTLREGKLDIDQNSFAKVVSFSPINLAESTSILSFFSSFIHLFKYILRHSAGEEQQLLPSRCYCDSLSVFSPQEPQPSFCWDTVHLAHARLLVMNLTFRCSLGLRHPWCIPSDHPKTGSRNSVVSVRACVWVGVGYNRPYIPPSPRCVARPSISSFVRFLDNNKHIYWIWICNWIVGREPLSSKSCVVYSSPITTHSVLQGFHRSLCCPDLLYWAFNQLGGCSSEEWGWTPFPCTVGWCSQIQCPVRWALSECPLDFCLDIIQEWVQNL